MFAKTNGRVQVWIIERPNPRRFVLLASTPQSNPGSGTSYKLDYERAERDAEREYARLIELYP